MTEVLEKILKFAPNANQTNETWDIYVSGLTHMYSGEMNLAPAHEQPQNNNNQNNKKRDYNGGSKCPAIILCFHGFLLKSVFWQSLPFFYRNFTWYFSAGTEELPVRDIQQAHPE